MELLTVDDFEAAARRRLDPHAWDYYAGGSRDEVTLTENRAAFERIRLRYRVLRDVSRRTAALELLGHELPFPILVAPTAFHRMAHPEGEAATARAAGRAGALMILSTLSTTAVEEVAEAGKGPLWFQLYVYRDRDATEGLVRRAEAAGCEALVVTVDAPVLGTRERDVHNRFSLPDELRIENLDGERSRLPEVPADSGLGAYVSELMDPSLNWEDLGWLTGVTELPVLVKGIVHPDDGRLAVEHGAAGVVVSNHGGRQLDTAPATVDALPDVVDAVDGRVPVVLDGGVRRGTDVVKALALGADAVAVGRPILWGLATEGEAGVLRVLEILRDELDEAMALCGVPTLADIGPELIFPGDAAPGFRAGDSARGSSR